MQRLITITNTAIFDKVESEELPGKVAFDPTLKRIKNLIHMNFWRNFILDSPGAGVFLENLKNSKNAMFVEQSE